MHASAAKASPLERPAANLLAAALAARRKARKAKKVNLMKIWTLMIPMIQGMMSMKFDTKKLS